MKLFRCTIAVLLLCGFSFHVSLADDVSQRANVRKAVKLRGLVIDFEHRCVDLEATVCLDEGLLELVACTKGSKEHESIVAVPAKAMHVHTALLLLGANNGHPAMRKQVGEREKRWVNVPPRGDEIQVFLVTTNRDGKPIERPISDFIVKSRQRVDEVDGEVIAAPEDTGKRKGIEKQGLPNSFLFAGSRLRDNGPGPRQYLADLSGNVISIATFGDELLCLPYRQTHEDNALMWRVKPDSLPEVGTKVTLRLRPKLKKPQPEDDSSKRIGPADAPALRKRTAGTDS